MCYLTGPPWALTRLRAALGALCVSLALLATASSQPARGPSANSGDSPATIENPIIGYVAQSSPPELRAILGVPGAAVFSDPLALPRQVTRIHLAPGQPYALLERSHAAPLVLQLNGSNPGQMDSMAGVLPGADIVAFSPHAHSAALFSGRAGRLQVITDLPGAPRITQDIDSGLLPEPPLAMAISDDGRSVFLSSARTVYLLLPDGSTRVVIGVAGIAALAFFPNTGNAVIGDRSTGSVYMVQGLQDGITTSVLATGLDGLGEISADGNSGTVYITRPSGRCIWSVVPSGEVRAFQLEVSPLRLDRLRNMDTFLISSEPGSPGWVFLRRGDDAQTVFVPAARGPGKVRRHVEPLAGARGDYSSPGEN